MELDAKVKELQAKNDEANASIDKFSQANKELTTQLDELNKEVASFEALQKKSKVKPKAKN